MNNKHLPQDLAAASLSLPEMAGQLFMPAAFINDTEVQVQKLEQLIKTYHPGGLCFFHSRASAATNFEGKKEIPFNAHSLGRLKELITRYQEASKYPLLIAMDAEWGLAMRVENTPQYPYALALGALADDDPLLYETGLRMAADCREAGIHWNLAPVVDCNTNPKNPVIGYRSFGSQVDAVTAKALLVFKGMRDGGLLTCAKHFPGHGDTAIDSHLALPILRKSLQELEQEELIPFKKLIQAGVPAVMTAHLSVPDLDSSETPASLSKPIIAEVLRKHLGFKGLVITDALNMHAVSKRESQPGLIAFKAFEAGNDMLCFAEDIPEAIDLILQSGSAQDIQARFNRIWEVKQEVFGARQNTTSPNYTPETLNTELAKKILTPVRISQIASCIKSDPLTLLDSGKLTQVFTSRIKDTHAPEFCISWDMTSDDPDSFPLPPTEQVILALAPPSIKPPQHFGFSTAALAALKNLLASHKVWVYHFGNPYALTEINVDAALALIMAYQPLKALQEAAANHFINETVLTGQLPVAITGI